MQPVLRVQGQTAADGQLQVVLTNAVTGVRQVIDV
jgi:hypothetical protein